MCAPCGTPIAIISGSALAAAFPVIFSNYSVENDLRWFGTLRGRVGWVSGPVLVYFTGGLAYADIERSASVAGRTTIGGVGTFNTFAGQFSASTIRTGWTLGTGVEGKLGGGWSVKAEYLYMDFGSLTDTFSTVFITSNAAGAQVGQVAATRTISTDPREQVFRIGLNYQFGNFYAPVVTK